MYHFAESQESLPRTGGVIRRLLSERRMCVPVSVAEGGNHGANKPAFQCGVDYLYDLKGIQFSGSVWSETSNMYEDSY